MSRLILPLALALTPLAAFSQITSLVTETFAEGQRTNLNLPNGLQWFSSAGASNVVYTPGTSITQNTGSSGRHLVGYFTPDGSPVTLSAGESLVVSFTITFNNAESSFDNGNNFRFGVFDSTPGTRMTGDSHGGTNTMAPTPFDGYTGYAAMFNLGNTNGIGGIWERTTVNGQAFISGVAAYTQIGDPAATGLAFSANTPYSFTYTLTRTADNQLGISLTATDGNAFNIAFDRTDATPSTFSFDTLGFLAISNVTDSYTLSQVSVGLTTIPEPAVMALLLATGGIGLVMFRRRRS